jgi:DNA-binding PadR family transcriptional regulator
MASDAAVVRARESRRPVRPATFQILMALVDGDRHGYAIMREVSVGSGGTMRLGPGTLYGSLKRLLEEGLVEESGDRAPHEIGDERRRYYRITPMGLAVVRAEAQRLETMVRAARRKHLLGLTPV